MKDVIIEVVKFILFAFFGSLAIIAVISVTATPAMLMRFTITHLGQENIFRLIQSLQVATATVIFTAIARVTLKAIADI